MNLLVSSTVKRVSIIILLSEASYIIISFKFPLILITSYVMVDFMDMIVPSFLIKEPLDHKTQSKWHTCMFFFSANLNCGSWYLSRTSVLKSYLCAFFRTTKASFLIKFEFHISSSTWWMNRTIYEWAKD